MLLVLMSHSVMIGMVVMIRGVVHNLEEQRAVRTEDGVQPDRL